MTMMHMIVMIIGDNNSTYLYLIRNKYGANKISPNSTEHINNTNANPSTQLLKIA